MLEKLLNFGIDNDYFKIKEIGQINKSCCKSLSVEVIDFDEVKKKISKEKDMQEPKSCDALKILINSDKLDFIEFKGFEEFINRELIKENDEIQDNKISEKIEEFKFNRKIEDSFFILKYILMNKKFEYSNKERDFFDDKVQKNYYILTDLNMDENPLEIFNLNLELLSEIHQNKDIHKKISISIKDNLSKIKNDYLINPPKLLTCESIKSIYNKA